MARDESNSFVCPECGVAVAPNADICPVCHATIRTARSAERLKSQLRHDTVIDPDLLENYEAERERSLRSQQRRERRPPGGPKRLEDANADDLRVVSAELIMPGSPAARAAARESRQVSREGPRSGGFRKVALPADPSSLGETPALDMVDPQRGKSARGQTDKVPRNPRPGTLGLIAAELEDSLEVGFQAWLGFTFSDHLSLLAAIGLIVSALLPWSHSDMGLLIGGELAWMFAAVTIAILVTRQRRLAAAAREDDADDDITIRGTAGASIGRLNLMQILLGLGAVLYVLGVMLGFYLSDPSPGRFDVRYGWFIALGSAMGLAYSGITCFVRDARRLRQ
ncbi:MAG: hypothetical protein JXR83_15850 [Deltaproteobacteria bacterium]|nr:hypothetical protein [Deltaproteobacteria bacterium]